MVPLEMFKSAQDGFPMEIVTEGNNVFITIDPSRLSANPAPFPRFPVANTRSGGADNPLNTSVRFLNRSIVTLEQYGAFHRASMDSGLHWIGQVRATVAALDSGSFNGYRELLLERGAILYRQP